MILFRYISFSEFRAIRASRFESSFLCFIRASSYITLKKKKYFSTGVSFNQRFAHVLPFFPEKKLKFSSNRILLANIAITFVRLRIIAITLRQNF